MTAKIQKNKSPTMRAYDPDLPMLASQAAIELDCIRIGVVQEKTPAVDRLAELLKNSIKKDDIDSSTPKFRSLVDSPTISLIERALSDSYQTSSHTLEGVLFKAFEVASELSKKDESKLDKIWRFCIELSRSASFYQSTNHVRPSHPFRS